MQKVSRKNKIRKKASRTNRKRKLDALWRQKIYERDNFQCQYPGCTKKNIQAAHVFSRIRLSCRWTIDNGITLCSGHHRYWSHVDYEAFRDLVLQRIGAKRFERLKEMAYQFKGKVDLEEVERSLQ